VTGVTVQVRLFAILRERAGRDSLTLELSEGATVADALDALAGEPALGELLERLPLGMAVNREYASVDATLGEGDELALIPPVSGGADAAAPAVAGAEIHVRITEAPLSLDALAQAVGRPGAGATVAFQGTTRTVQRLDYAAYREMAQTQIEAILRECVQRHGLQAAAAEHRIGSVPLGEASVVVAVSSAHRPQAFAAAREAIDRIKAEAPIWKREIDGGESGRWAQGTPAPGAK
jgi:molybdopterin converting factor subunit 1